MNIDRVISVLLLLSSLSYAQLTGTFAGVLTTYTPTATTPTFVPVAGSYSGTQSVTISTNAACSSYVYWSTNNNPPTVADTNGTSVSVASSETVYAKAIGCPGYNDSAVGSAAYTISVGVQSTCGNTATATTTNGGNDNYPEIEPSCVTGSNAAGYSVQSFVIGLQNGSASYHINCGVYTAAADPNKALVCSTGTTVLPTTTGDFTIAISGCGTLAANTTYWLGCNTDYSALSYQTITDASGTDEYIGATYPSLPNPYGSGSTQTRTNRWFLNVTTQ